MSKHGQQSWQVSCWEWFALSPGSQSGVSSTSLQVFLFSKGQNLSNRISRFFNLIAIGLDFLIVYFLGGDFLFIYLFVCF